MHVKLQIEHAFSLTVYQIDGFFGCLLMQSFLTVVVLEYHPIVCLHYFASKKLQMKNNSYYYYLADLIAIILLQWHQDVLIHYLSLAC